MSETSFEIFKDKKIIITGHTGFKGSWLTIWLDMLGAKVFGISKDIPTEPSMFDDLKLEKSIEHIVLDIRNHDKMKAEFLRIQPDFVFHLAAQPIVSISYSDPIDTISTNTLGTAIVMDAMRGLEKKCVGIFVTSDKCYENVEWEWGYKETDRLGGKDIYSGSKGAAEIVFHSFFLSYFSSKPNLRVATGRAGNVIGGGDWAKDRIVPDCIKSWSEGKKVVIRNPYATRPWQHVLEPLSGYLNLAVHLWESEKLNGQSFNFGPYPENNVTVLKLLKKLCKRFGFENGEEAYIYEKMKSFKEANLLMLNCDKALYHLQWRPTLNLRQLVNFTGDWYKYNHLGETNILEFTKNQINEFVELASEKEIGWAAKNEELP